MNYTLHMVFIYLVSAQVCTESLSFTDALVNLSQYRGSVGFFNNINFSVQSKFSHFLYLSDSNNNNNNNLENGLLILLNKTVLALLLLNVMYLLKGSGTKHEKTFIWSLFSTFVSCNLLCWIYIVLITPSGDVKQNPRP